MMRMGGGPLAVPTGIVCAEFAVRRDCRTRLPPCRIDSDQA
jgi:hypothetical protein